MPPWVKGQSGNYQGRRKSSVTEALKARVNPDEIAELLIEIASDHRTNKRERLQAIAMILDRTEGKPLARNLNINASAVAAALPIGFDDLDVTQKMRILDEVRQRALSNTLTPPASNPVLVSGDDDEQD